MTGLVEARGDQHVAEIVHVGEGVHARIGRGRAQLLQGVGSQRAEHDQAVRREHPGELAEYGKRIVHQCSAMFDQTSPTFPPRAAGARDPPQAGPRRGAATGR